MLMSILSFFYYLDSSASSVQIRNLRFLKQNTAESDKLDSHATSRPLSRVSSTRMKTGRGEFSRRSLTFAGRAPIKSTNRNESYNTGAAQRCWILQAKEAKGIAERIADVKFLRVTVGIWSPKDRSFKIIITIFYRFILRKINFYNFIKKDYFNSFTWFYWNHVKKLFFIYTIQFKNTLIKLKRKWGYEPSLILMLYLKNK